MIRSKRNLIVIACVAMLWLEGIAPVVAYEKAVEPARRDDTSSVVPIGVPGTVFANAELRLRFACHRESSIPWQASAARRPFASGVVESKGGQLKIRLRTPNVKEGVVLPIQIAVGDAVCKILVFGRDPLAERRQWAKELQIVLFDPLGKTAMAFDEITLPYRRLTGLGALATVTKGMIVVGEGLPLADHPGLDKALCQVARQGVPILLLTPASGEFTITDPAPKRFELQDASAGQQLDSRTVGDLTQPRSYRVSGAKDGPVLRITDDSSSYAWGAFRFDNARGQLCCIGWNLLDQWESSPAPRFFFVRLLEIVSSGKYLPGGKKSD